MLIVQQHYCTTALLYNSIIPRGILYVVPDDGRQWGRIM